MAITHSLVSAVPDGGNTSLVRPSDWNDDHVVGNDLALPGNPTTTTQSAGNNTTRIATTAFVVAEILARLASNDAMLYKGAIDASSNPNYPAADAGHTYRISVAGKIGGGSGPNVEAGDIIICHTDSSAGGTHASVGADWDIIQINIDGAVTLTGTQTLTNKRVTARVGTTASSATPTPDADAHDEYTVTALAAGATFGAPSGTPTEGQALIIRIKDNGTARTLAFNAIYRAIGATLPTTTVISKTMYLGMLYNSSDSKWDVLSVIEEA